MSEIDFNKLIKDIISAARGEATANLNRVKYFGEDNKLSITLKLEVTISKKSTQVSRIIKKAPGNLFC
jgi:hypothetical protein